MKKLSRYLVIYKIGESYFLWARKNNTFFLKPKKENVEICVYTNKEKLRKEIQKLYDSKRAAPDAIGLLKVEGKDKEDLDKNLINAITKLTGGKSINDIIVKEFGPYQDQAGWYVRNKEYIDEYKQDYQWT